MFQTVLKEVVEGTEGGLATLLMDFEGIAVDSYSKPDAPFDITTIGAEVAIQAEKVTTLIRVVNASYFVALSLSPDGNIGKARYMLRTRVPKLREELA